MLLTGHRRSYVKTMLTTGSVSLVSVFLAIMWTADAEIEVLGGALSRAEHPMSFWTLVGLFGIVGLACAVVVAGGVICLHREWGQHR